MDLLPLEKIFIKISENKSLFPRLAESYGVRYQGLVNHLRANIYKDIDAGLAANSQMQGFYTAHNSEHFDEVIRYAGALLGIESGEKEFTSLTPYELYVLLVAIRIHDAGNIEGREDHEKKCFHVLRSCGAASGDDDGEKKKIGLIAQSHGGRTALNSKDTISELAEREYFGNLIIRPRLIAAILRFADEICEGRNRAANYLLKIGKLPKHSEVFHKYASCINACVATREPSRITIKYTVSVEDVGKKWGCSSDPDNNETYLIDEILDRLEKMDRERRYCNRFSREVYTIDSIRASIDIVDQNLDIVKTIAVPDLCDMGYPDERKGHLKEKLKEFCGEQFSQSLTSGKA